MLDVLTAPEGVAFTAALVLMLAIGAVEALGLGASGLDLDLDLDAGDGGLFGWLGLGEVPLLVFLIAFLAAFGAIGLAGQQVAHEMLGEYLRPLIAVPAAGATALPVTALLSRVLARIIPHDETSAVGVDELIGRTATITLGRAVAGSPARARVVDQFGQTHHVLAEPADDQALEEGDEVLLVRRDGHLFHATLHVRPRYSDWSLP